MKNWVYQIHWFLGITAGLVLAVMGTTGALVSFDQEIMESVSPGVARVDVRNVNTAPRTPDALLDGFRSKHPGVWVESITLASDPLRNALIKTASKEKNKRGEEIYVDPYTGEELGQLRGQDFFRTALELHRWLLIPRGEGVNIGRQITGFSAIALVFFALSGLYLRWPRRALHWRSWFHINFKLRGRNLYWALHSVIGTWLLVVYLLLALTGLSWSYSWYKNGLSIVLTGEALKERSRAPKETPKYPDSAPAVANAWQGFLKETYGNYGKASIAIPLKPDSAITITYLLPNALHERQRNTLTLNASGEVKEAKPYVKIEPLGKRIYQGMYELHTGIWFGMPGRIVNTVASLFMLLFTITGFLLYLDRRKKKRDAKRAASTATALAAGISAPANYLVVYASQTGTAEQLAWHTASILKSGGINPIVKSLSSVTNELLETTEKALFILSTFGEGEPPDSARVFIKKSMKLNPALSNLQFGLLALGDKRYRDYCGFASQVEAWLLVNGARNLFTRVDVDNGDEHAIQQWQQHIAAISGVTTITKWSAPEYELWTLHSRTLLNAGSVGAAIYSVALIPPHIGNTRWEAGDILEIKPQHDPAIVDKFINDNGLDAAQLVNNISLKSWLSKSVLPNTEQISSDVNALIKSLEPLPHREYSIASLPTCGKLELVIRQTFNGSGNLGLGSGWLTAYAREGEKVWVRIRSNPSFHAPQVAAPMILIGAGTGIAGLRAHLQARHIAGEKENWLIFGERQRKHDRLFGEEINELIHSGFLMHCDEVFSRDGDSERYAQDRLVTERERLIDWLSRGASILVCGSLTNMGAGVDEALSSILGENELQSLCESGRYRRDLY